MENESSISDAAERFCLYALHHFAVTNERQMAGKFVALDESHLDRRLPDMLASLLGSIRQRSQRGIGEDRASGFFCSLPEVDSPTNAGLVLRLVLAGKVQDIGRHTGEGSFFNEALDSLTDGKALRVFYYFIKSDTPHGQQLSSFVSFFSRSYDWSNRDSRAQAVLGMKSQVKQDTTAAQRLVVGVLVPEEQEQLPEIMPADESSLPPDYVASAVGLFLTQIGISSSEAERAQAVKTRALAALLSHGLKGPLQQAEFGLVEAWIQDIERHAREGNLDLVRDGIANLREDFEMLRSAVNLLRSYIPLFDNFGAGAVENARPLSLYEEIMAATRDLGEVTPDHLDGLDAIDGVSIRFPPLIFKLLLRECFRNAQEAALPESGKESLRWLFEGAPHPQSQELYVLTVANNGPLIPAEIRSQLFRQPIERGSRAGKKPGAGQALWALGRVFLDFGLPAPLAWEDAHPETRGPAFDFTFSLEVGQHD